VLSDGLTWLAAIAFALSIGVWINWYARRVSEDDERPMPLARPVLTTAVFVLLLAGALVTYGRP
jgi:uncharacterized membrane protein SpoIIM required for sporulation